MPATLLFQRPVGVDLALCNVLRRRLVVVRQLRSLGPPWYLVGSTVSSALSNWREWRD